MDKIFLCSSNFATNYFRTWCCKTLKAESSLVLATCLDVSVTVLDYAAAAVILSVGTSLLHGLEALFIQSRFSLKMCVYA